jgi:hypothetical protein
VRPRDVNRNRADEAFVSAAPALSDKSTAANGAAPTTAQNFLRDHDERETAALAGSLIGWLTRLAPGKIGVQSFDDDPTPSDACRATTFHRKCRARFLIDRARDRTIEGLLASTTAINRRTR